MTIQIKTPINNIQNNILMVMDDLHWFDLHTATESDEISFHEGDILGHCEQIDSGWMLGRNPKTGQQDLLSSNYVEIIG